MTADQTTPDALRALTVPIASPSLTVLREMTEGRESFRLSHEPMPCPPIPPAPPRIARKRRAHVIHSLTDLGWYLAEVAKDCHAFYTGDRVQVVLDPASEEEHEVITCTLMRHPSFLRLTEAVGKPMSQRQFVAFLRAIRPLLEDSQADYLIGVYSSLTGQLTHDCDEHLDMQSRSATFIVRRKGRGNATPQDKTIEDVPTEFTVLVPILIDDKENVELRVVVQMSGSEGAEIVFTISIEGLAELVQDHIERRLQAFAEGAVCICVRGEYRTEEWTQPRLPDAVRELLVAQTEMVAAMAGRQDD